MSGEEDSVSEEDLTSDDDIPNDKQVTEAAVIESLFVTCDVEKLGYISVSRLIEYLRRTTGSITENGEDLECLSLMFDPNGEDCVVDLKRCQEIMPLWIEKLRIKNDTGSEFEDISDGGKESAVLGLQYHSTDITGEENCNKTYDAVELQNKLGDMQIQNCKLTEEIGRLQQRLDDQETFHFQCRRLVEENGKLQQQLDNQEEVISHSSTEINALKRKIKSLQEIVDLRTQTQIENEELKVTLSKLHESRRELQHKLGHSEKTVLSLELNITEFENKILYLSEQKESLNTSYNELCKSVTSYKHKIIQLNEEKNVLEYQLSVRLTELADLKSQIQYLNKANNDLNVEKNDLQTELKDTHLTSLHLTSGGYGLPENMSFDGDKSSSDQKHHGFIVCSTPMKPGNSICMELKNMLNADKHLPSPLCEKEPFPGMHDDPHLSLEGIDDEEEDVPEGILSVSQKDEFTIEISNFCEKYEQQQNEVTEDVEKILSKLEKEENDAVTSARFMQKLEKKMQKLLDKFFAIAKAKEITDERLNDMKGKLKQMSEENFVLNKTSKQCERLLLDLDKNVDGTVDNRILLLKNKLEEERSKVKKLENQLRKKSPSTQGVKKKDTINREKLIGEKILKAEIRKLKRANKELMQRNQKPEGNPRSMDRKDRIKKCAHHLWLDVDCERLYNKQNLNYNDLTESVEDVSQSNKSEHGSQLTHNYTQLSEENPNVNLSPVCVDGQYLYQRCRSHSFQAAVDNGQKTPESESYSFLPVTTSTHPKQYLCNDSFVSSVYLQNNNYINSSVQSRYVSDMDFTVNSNYLSCTDTSHNHPVSYTDDTEDSSNLRDCNSMKKTTSGPTYISTSAITFDQNCWRDAAKWSAISNDSTASSDGLPGSLFINHSSSPCCAKKLSVLVEEENQTDSKTENKSLTTNNNSADSSVHSCIHDRYASCVIGGATCYRNRQCHALCGSKKHRNLSEPTICKAHVCGCTCIIDESKTAVERLLEGSDQSTEIKLSAQEICCGCSQAEEKKQLMDDRVAANVLNSSVTSQLSNQLQKLTLNDKDLSQMEDDEEESELTSEEMTRKMGCDQLIKLRKDNLAKRRKQMKFMRMPDLTETLETGLLTNMSNSNSVVPVIEENSEEEGEEETLGDNVMPSIPESFLEQMGLSSSQKTTTGPDQLSEEEVEKKFMKLALAFKTDKITLEKRKEIQERSRDIAEENVAKEVKGLREACDKMNQICLDAQVREVLLKIQKHVDVMEQASTRVSSRAEVYGAVQQERRMSKAIEIMLLHVENLRMMHEREHAELEEAKRLIQDNRPFGGSSGYEFGRRSLSVCPETAMHSRMSKRRVSEVIGKSSGGLGSLSRSESTETFLISDNKPPSLKREASFCNEDPRQRFQQVVSSTASKNNIVSSLRRTSLEKQSNSSSVNRPSDNFSENGSTLKSVSKQNSEEEAFQKGFQQGCKAQISGQLAQLRDQQNSVTQKLEDLRDTLEEEEVSPPISLKEVVIQKVWQIAPDYDTISKHFRVTMAGFVFLMAICSIVLSFFPVSQATVEVYPQYRHVNKPTL